MIGRPPELCPHGVLGKSKCKECLRKTTRESRRRIRRLYPEKSRQRRRAHYAKNKARGRELSYKWKENNPEKVRAHNLMYRNPKKYPLAESCEFCGSTEYLQHGHIDYDYPEIYLTVCAKCNWWMGKSTRKSVRSW